MSIDGINRTPRRPTRGSYSHALLKPRRKAAYATPEKRVEKPEKLTREASADTTKAHRTVTKHKPALPRQTRSAVLVRRTFKPKIKKRRKLSLKVNAKMLILLGIVGINVSLLGYVLNDQNSDAYTQTANAPSVLGTSEQDNQGLVPSEAAVTEEVIDEYKVAPDLPKSLEIPRLQVSARIVRMAVRNDNKLGLPENIFDVGWHDVSAKPGEMGAVLLHGHVTGTNEPGVFARVGNLQKNDELIIRRGDDRVFTYRVTSIERVDRDALDTSSAVTVDAGAENGLTLVSHSSRFDVSTNKYEQRLVIKAVQQ